MSGSFRNGLSFTPLVVGAKKINKWNKNNISEKETDIVQEY